MYIEEIVNTIAILENRNINTKLSRIADILIEAKKNDKAVFTIGNGGSASTASHFANDLTKMAGLRTLALPDMVATMMAFMNDNGSERMFTDAFKVFAKPGDVLFAISCSGNSRNVVDAIKTANSMKCPTILLTGALGGLGINLAGHTIKVEHPDIRVQEDFHLVFCHALAGTVRDAEA